MIFTILLYLFILLGLLLHGVNIIVSLRVFFIEMLQFPDSLAGALLKLGVGLLDDDDVWQLVLVHLLRSLVVIQLLHLQLSQIVAHNSIIEVNDFTKMSVDDKSTIVDSEFALSSDFESNHAELLSSCGSRCGHIKVDIFDIEDDEAGEEFTAALGLEHVLPVMGGVDLMSTHCVHINDVDCSSDLIDKN